MGDRLAPESVIGMGWNTHLNEIGWNSEAIEPQLAHVEGDAVRAPYNYAKHLLERRRMMQARADYRH